jgi:magnesium transporter
VTTALDIEMAVLRKFVNELLTQLEEDIDRERLRNLLVYSKKLSAFEKKASLIRDALAEVLNNGLPSLNQSNIDEDLAGMYLTEKSRGRQRDVDQHDEVELLLEAYVKQVDGIVQEADQLASNMRNTEEIVNIILDANRNSLMLLDLKVSMTTLGIGSGAAIAGLLGMNLKNYMEDWSYGFPVVTSIALGMSIVVCGYGLTRLKRIQKLTLYGRYPGTGVKRKLNGLKGTNELTEYDVDHLTKLKKWKMMMFRRGRFR